MLYDNSTQEKSVITWINQQTSEGNLDSTSGYFTVGVLSHISQTLNDKIKNFRFLLGDIVSTDLDKDQPINLLTETITVDAALQLNKLAKEAVAFLKQENVKLRTVEPNFCHAKTILFRSKNQPLSYFVTGSSNLTEAGLGMHSTANIELNVAGQGSAADYPEICRWFDDLWEWDKTQTFKTVEGKRVPFKRYVIEQIEAIFKQYTPHELYYKTLFELFKGQMADLESDPDFQQRIGHLKHTKIFKTLYDFQQKGVLSLIKKIETYQGAILADAVGLGKTWSALAVIKYFELKGYQSILLCPKKISTNWQRYQRNHNSIFEQDSLDYVIRYHTDLQDNRLETNHSDGLRLDTFFQSDKPKLFIIDESHNLRNHKSGRYKFLVEKLLQANPEVKVLLLSATPINNDFKDLRNQLALLVKGDDKGFDDAPHILVDSLESKFKTASKAFNEWSKEDDRTIGTLIEKLPEEVIRLIDHLLVARTRKHIKGLSDNLTFPEMQPPQNEYLTSLNIAKYNQFEDILKALPKYFAAYKPAVYIEPADNLASVLEDESRRDQFLVVMLNKLLVKRLESSWHSFHKTLITIKNVHQRVLSAVHGYAENKQNAQLESSDELFSNLDVDLDIPLGKRAIQLSEIDNAGNLSKFKTHLESDVLELEKIIQTLDVYSTIIDLETAPVSQDSKLTRLIELIHEQCHPDKPADIRKLLLFTSYKDTAEYLFRELGKRGISNIACISGDGAKTSQVPDQYQKNFEPILERFCPYTKLYRERDWLDYENKDHGWGAFEHWKTWVSGKNPTVADQLANPIEIIIATDCLSEGQNLQDCDTVINYDIHWNPVRLIQRLGRIDRIGSPNTQVRGINFWPAASMNDYLNLQGRVENRAIAIAAAGSEVPILTDEVGERLNDVQFKEKQEARMLKHMESSWEDLEDQNDSLSFSDLSLEIFRQDLIKEITNQQNIYASMPLGIFSGFKAESEDGQSGLVALLGYPSRKNGNKTPYQRHNLVYLDLEGNPIIKKPGKVLKFLSDHHSLDRIVPTGIDQNETENINRYAQSIKSWLQTFSEGDAMDDLLAGLQGGDLATQESINDSNTLEQQYDPNNCDLILWFCIS